MALAAEYASNPLDAVSTDPLAGGEPEPDYTLDGDVAIVPVDGLLLQRALFLCGAEIIAGYDTIGSRLQAAFAADEVGAIVLAIDSPGGECAGCAELASAIGALSEATGKPVEAYAGEMAASAAYWLASSAGGITVPRTGRVGSIGTVATTYNVAGAVAAAGQRAIVSAYPAGKSIGHRAILTNASEDVDGAFRARMDRVTRELTAVFAGHVAERRGMSVDDVIALDADMFMGAMAVDKGLADRVGGLSVAIDAARSRIKKREYSMPGSNAEQGAKAAILDILNVGGLQATPTTAEQKPEVIEAAAKEAARLADLGRSLEALTGQKGAAAIEIVKAWQEGHGRVAGLENRVKVERLRGRDAMKVPPAAAFGVLPENATLPNGGPHPMAGLSHPDAGPHPDYAAMSLGVFDARLDAATLHPAATKAPTPVAMSPIGLTAEEESICKARGIDPAAYAKNKARVMGEEVKSNG